jgi:ribosomal protein S1
MALGYARNRFFRDRQRNEPGRILQCNVLVAGPKRILVECNGFDISIRNRELSYTAIADLRSEYKPGQEISARLKSADPQAGTIEISVKEVNPNPYFGAEKRHPVGSTRKAVISGTYAGGVFCRLSDDTTCMCLYSPNYFKEEFYIGDSVLISISRFDDGKKQVYGRILSKL